jgi:hypothetical protein
MKQEILKLRSEGKSLDEIASILNCSKSTASYHCNPDVKARSLAFRRKNRKIQSKELKELYGGKCSICGYNKCLDALHFHHKDPNSKDGAVGNILNEKGKNAAYEEAKKCDLICANCHAELHAD